ncbi:MAG: hypothetical protein AAGO57_05105 [Pseudomonadota bacterium]
MERLLIAALIVGAGYFVWTEYAGTPTISAGSGGSGGAGFSSFGKAAGTVGSGAVAATKN